MASSPDTSPAVGDGISLSTRMEQDFDRVVDTLGHTPSQQEYIHHGSHHIHRFISTVSPDIHSYRHAVLELGYPEPDTTGSPPSNKGRPSIPPDELARDFNAVVDDLGYVPTSTEYTEHGRYSSNTLATKLGPNGVQSYPAAVRSLGHEPPNPSPRGEIPPERVKQDFERVMARDDTEDIPTTLEYRRHGRYSLPTLLKKFSETNRYYDAVENMGYSLSSS